MKTVANKLPWEVIVFLLLKAKLHITRSHAKIYMWLSTYLGHINIQSTQHYLQYMLEVLMEANRRFESSFSTAGVQK